MIILAMVFIAFGIGEWGASVLFPNLIWQFTLSSTIIMLFLVIWFIDIMGDWYTYIEWEMEQEGSLHDLGDGI